MRREREVCLGRGDWRCWRAGEAPAPRKLSKRLGHSYQMARLVCLLVRRKGQGTAFGIAEAVVKPGQFLAQVHDGQVHELAACVATIFFRSGDHASSEARTLYLGIDREQAEISALSAKFHVDAAG